MTCDEVARCLLEFAAGDFVGIVEEIAQGVQRLLAVAQRLLHEVSDDLRASLELKIGMPLLGVVERKKSTDRSDDAEQCNQPGDVKAEAAGSGLVGGHTVSGRLNVHRDREQDEPLGWKQ